MTPAEQVEIWANAYYNGDPMVDDATYDAFCKKHGISSGLQGSELKTTREPKFKHTLVTGTLAKAESLEDDEFRKWQNRVGNGFVNVSMKIDGSSQELLFKNGNFEQAITRGNGIEGVDRTETVKFILAARNQLNPIDRYGEMYNGSVRGEMVIYEDDFQKHLKNKFANARNAVAGMMNRKWEDVKPEDREDYKLIHFIAYDALDDKDFETQTQLMTWLNLHFETPDYITTKVSDVKTFNSWRDTVRQKKYACDGIVLKQDKIDRSDRQRPTPLMDIAVKPENFMAVSVVRDIVWDQSGSYLSPVAVIDPTEILGVTVTRASLANLNIMKELGVEIGKTVSVTRRGDVIPHIMAVLD